MDTKKNQNPPEPDYPVTDWSKMEALEDQLLLEATQLYEERLREKETIKATYERNKKIVLNLDNQFLTSVYRKYVVWAYLYNLSLIVLNYKVLRNMGIRRFKKYTINTFLFVFGNGVLARYWLHDYPLKEFNLGKVRIQSNQVLPNNKI
jgi:hypothetical protein